MSAEEQKTPDAASAEPAAQAAPAGPANTLRNIVVAGYALQAAGFITGGLGNLIAVILAYVKRDDARGTEYEQHLRWQINTFWVGLVGCVLGTLTWLILIGIPIFFATTVWLIYRIIKGGLALHEGKPLYPNR